MSRLVSVEVCHQRSTQSYHSAAMPVDRLSLYYTGYAHDRARALNVRARTAEGWTTLAANWERDFDRFEYVRGHPVMGSQLQTLRFAPVRADAVRLEIADPEPGRDWTIGEMALWAAPSEEPAAP